MQTKHVTKVTNYPQLTIGDICSNPSEYAGNVYALDKPYLQSSALYVVDPTGCKVLKIYKDGVVSIFSLKNDPSRIVQVTQVNFT